MSLAWVRLDTGIAHHDKTLGLVNDPSPKRWQAAASYVYSLGWSGEHGTDGFIPNAALPFIHGTRATANLLVRHGFWAEAAGGWRIRNYAVRQELAVITAAKKEAQRVASIKANCTRWHGKDCGCWKAAIEE
jgi:hypothetical protein